MWQRVFQQYKEQAYREESEKFEDMLAKEVSEAVAKAQAGFSVDQKKAAPKPLVKSLSLAPQKTTNFRASFSKNKNPLNQNLDKTSDSA